MISVPCLNFVYSDKLSKEQIKIVWICLDEENLGGSFRHAIFYKSMKFFYALILFGVKSDIIESEE